jgi:hypothetical protein
VRFADLNGQWRNDSAMTHAACDALLPRRMVRKALESSGPFTRSSSRLGRIPMAEPYREGEPARLSFF